MNERICPKSGNRCTNGCPPTFCIEEQQTDRVSQHQRDDKRPPGEFGSDQFPNVGEQSESNNQ